MIKIRGQDYLLMLFFGIFLILVFWYSNMDSFSYALEDEVDILKGAYLNPEWIEYVESSDEEKAEYELIPEVYLYDAVEEKTSFSYDFAEADGDYPSYYNLRALGLVTDVKDQANTGLCWAFASNASLESNLLISGLSSIDSPVTFSERQLDYFTTNKKFIVENYNPYYNSIRDELGSGGSYDIAFGSYFTGLSPVATSSFGDSILDKSNKSLKEVFDLENVEYYLESYHSYGNISASESNSTRESFISKIKSHIMQYGALYLVTKGPNSYSGGSCFYKDTVNNISLLNVLDDNCNPPIAGAHALAIIGWDDDYEYEYCRLTSSTSSDLTNCDNIVSGKGAFILKNSWGNSTSYPYIAYTSILRNITGAVSVIEKDFDNNYDISKKYTSNFASNTVIFTYETDSELKERLERINFTVSYVSNTVSALNVYVSTDGGDNYEFITTKYINDAGGYSVDLSGYDITSDKLKINDKLKIKITSDTSIPDSIYAFTSYYDEEDEMKIISKFGSDVEYNESSSEIDFYTLTKNIPTGDYLEYRLIDDNGNDISSLITVSDNVVFNNIVQPKIIINDKINADTVTIQTLYNGEVFDSDSFDIIHIYGDNFWTYGDGSLDNPYMIYTLNDFKNIWKNSINVGANYKLGADIDFSSEIWNVNDYQNSVSFTGSLDGDGHSLYGIRCDTSSDCSLFYKIENATIKNLVISDFVTEMSGVNISVLALTAYDSNFENIIVTDSVVISGSSPFVGGLIGTAYDSFFYRIANYGTYTEINTYKYTSAVYLGGIVNKCYGCDIVEVYNYGDITSRSNYVSAGGIVGMTEVSSYTSNYTTIRDSYNFGTIVSSNRAGGIVGLCYTCYITNSYNISEYVEQRGRYGNIVSYANGAVLNNLYYYDNGQSYVGTNKNSTISNVVGKTLDNLKLKSTYSGFDFEEVWAIDDSYPYLKNFYYSYIEQIDVDDVILNFGEAQKIEVSFVPETATIKRLVYISSDEGVVSIDNNGNMIARGVGDAIITIETVDGSNISKQIKVSVIAKLETDEYEVIDDTYIKINSLSSREDVLDNLVEDNSLFDFELSESDNENIVTGDKVFMYDKNGILLKTYIISVLGDVIGNGTIKINGVAKAYQYIKGAIDMDYEYQIAADVTMDGIVKINDVAKLYQYIKGNIESLEG